MMWLLSPSGGYSGASGEDPAAPQDRPAQISVVVVSKQRTLADALALRLRAEPDITVVAVSQSTAMARRVLIGRQITLLLLDSDLPGDAAFGLCAEVTAAIHGPRILMVGDVSGPSRIAAAVRAGADGWVSKEESIDHLIEVIHRVARGEAWLPPSQLGAVLRLLMEERNNCIGEGDLLATLTPRERDVLFHLIQGAGRKEVAERLQLSANTVRTHLRNLMTKLGAHSTLELVAMTRSTINFPPTGGHDSAPPH